MAYLGLGSCLTLMYKVCKQVNDIYKVTFKALLYLIFWDTTVFITTIFLYWENTTSWFCAKPIGPVGSEIQNGCFLGNYFQLVVHIDDGKLSSALSTEALGINSVTITCSLFTLGLTTRWVSNEFWRLTCVKIIFWQNKSHSLCCLVSVQIKIWRQTYEKVPLVKTVTEPWGGTWVAPTVDPMLRIAYKLVGLDYCVLVL